MKNKMFMKLGIITNSFSRNQKKPYPPPPLNRGAWPKNPPCKGNGGGVSQGGGLGVKEDMFLQKYKSWELALGRSKISGACARLLKKVKFVQKKLIFLLRMIKFVQQLDTTNSRAIENIIEYFSNTMKVCSRE
jgi:hypothetical protein